MVRRSPVKNTRRPVRRLPLREGGRGVLTARDRLMPPPVRGWNARDALSAMRPDNAVFLRNWFPKQSSLITRPGYSEHCDTGSGAEISQIIPFEYSTSSKLLACSDGTIYDVTTATPSSLETSLNGNDWSYDYLGGYVLMANGADSPRAYDGSTVTTPAFTGPTLANLESVSTFKSRLYFVEKNSQSMWYGGVGAVTGPLTQFDFSTVAPVRGNLVFTSHLKGDGGDGGADDILVAVFEEGDCLAYSGSDPGDPTDWALVGHYRIGRPLGRMAYVNLADDLYVATDRGYEKISQVVTYGSTAPDKALLSYPIQRAVSEVISEVGESVDWRLFAYPKGQMFMVSIPNTGTRRQHVQNINTGAWCEFRAINSECWATWEGNAYFGHTSDGKVYAFDDGTVTDNGTAIRCDAHQAWTDMGYGSRLKQVELIRPYFFAGYNPSISITVGKDYDTIEIGAFAEASSSTQNIWDVPSWDEVSWGEDNVTQSRWFGRNALGSVIGWRVIIDVTAAGGVVEWNNTQVLFTVGQYI